MRAKDAASCALQASGIVFNTGNSLPPRSLHVSILQRMSDARYPSVDTCGGSFINGTCWLGEGWQAVAVAGLAAIKDFNNRDGTWAPILASPELAACDKKIAHTVLDTQARL